MDLLIPVLELTVLYRQAFIPCRPLVFVICVGWPSGDLTAEEAGADVVVSGSARVGGQDHFYLETNCSLVSSEFAICIPACFRKDDTLHSLFDLSRK